MVLPLFAAASAALLSGPAGMPFLHIHNWPAFWIVVCLGTTQVLVTYYGSRLTVEGLPAHVPDHRRRRHRRVFAGLYLLFICLTLLLAKLNDANEYKAAQQVQQERGQLQQTLETVRDSQNELQTIRTAVQAHPPGQERSSMLSSIDRIQHNLDREEDSMRPDRDR